MSERLIHTVTITGCEGCAESGEPECTCYPQQFDVKVTCPGVVDSCRAWEECMECNALGDDDDARLDLEETGVAHDQEHTQLECGWSTPTTHCILVVHDEIREIVESSFPGDVKPGVYQARMDLDDFDLDDFDQPRLEFLQAVTL